MKTVYISNDGKEFSSAEACKRHESRNSIEELQKSVKKLSTQREILIAQKNAIKANKFGYLPKFVSLVAGQEEEIKKLTKKNLKKTSIETLEKVRKSINSLIDARHNIVEEQQRLKKIKLQIIELKEEIKNAELRIAELYANKRG